MSAEGGDALDRVARQAARGQLVKVGGPEMVVILAKPPQVLPRVDAAVVPIIEDEADGVVADGLDAGDANKATAGGGGGAAESAGTSDPTARLMNTPFVHSVTMFSAVSLGEPF